MIIRDLKLEDFDAVNNLFLQLHTLHAEQRPDIYRKIEKPTTSKAWDYEASLADNNFIKIGAEVDGKIVGFCIIRICQTTNKVTTSRIFAFLQNIAVAKDYRRKGIATALYREGVKRAKGQGATSMELKVWNFNVDAIRFYQSLGLSVQSLNMEQVL